MIFEEKEILLKNGQLCLLRSPTAEDAEGMISYLRQTSGETSFMARYEDEVTMTADEEGAFLSAILDDPKAVMIAAFVNGQLVANVGLSKVAPREKYAHRAVLGISIIKDYWGLGLGAAMMQAATDAAKAMGYEQLELEVVTENLRAVALYQRFGFVTFGMREHSFKFRDGSYCSEYLMIKKL